MRLKKKANRCAMTTQTLRYKLVQISNLGKVYLKWAVLILAFFVLRTPFYAQEDAILLERKELANLVELELWSEIDLSNEKVEEYYILTGHEKEWLHLLMSDFNGFFETLQFNEDYYESSKLKRTIRQDYYARFFGIAEYFSTFDRLNEVMQLKMQNDLPTLAKKVLSSDLNDEQKRFILLYLSYYRYQFDVCDEELLQAASNEFNKQQFESQDLSSFVIKYESTLAALANRSVLFGMGLGANALIQKPSNINTGFLFNFLFDYNFKRFHLGSRILIQQHRTKIAFESLPQYDENRPFGLFYFDVYGGMNADFFDSKFILQPYLGYGFGFFRGVNEVEEPNFSTIQVNSGFLGLKTQYVFNRKRLCDNRLAFVNQQHYAAFFDISFRARPFGSATPELIGHGLLFNFGVVINSPLLKKSKAID